MSAPRHAAGGRPAAAWRRLLAGLGALALLNALLGMELALPSLWPRPAARVSFELAMALWLLAGWIAWRGAAGARVLRLLAACSVAWIVARYLDILVSAVFGRQVNLYWDGRHAWELLRTSELGMAGLVALALLALLLPWVLHLFAHRAWRAVAALLEPPSAAPWRRLAGVAGAVLLAAFTLHAGEARNTRWFMSMPVAPILAGQARLLADQLIPGRIEQEVGTGPAFDAPLDGIARTDVLLIFAESYGAVTLDDPRQAAWLAPHRARFEQALHDSGRAVVSARVRSPTFGGGSWLAHAAFLTGIDTREPGRYERLLASDRTSLVRQFGHQGWHTVAWMPGLQKAWPEGRFYGFDRIVDGPAAGYRGPALGPWRIPDQASMALLHAEELAAPPGSRAPRFVVFPTISSHAPFRPVPPFVEDWPRLLGGDPFAGTDLAAALAQPVSWLQPVPGYLESLAYTYRWLGSYLAEVAPRRLLTIVVGDHQPLASVSGRGASWDVPIHVIGADPQLLQRLQEAGFSPGLLPAQPSGAGMHEMAARLLGGLTSALSP